MSLIFQIAIALRLTSDWLRHKLKTFGLWVDNTLDPNYHKDRQ